MTLQTENGAPSFYTFPSFHPRRNALLYGAVLSLLAFCAITLVFNYGIREKLWSYTSADSTSYAEPVSNSRSEAETQATITRITLSSAVLRSLEGDYFSAETNRTYVISVSGQQIYLQIDHQAKIELIPVSEDTLYAGEGHLIKFTANSAGQIDHIDLYDNGQHMIARRR